MGCQHGLSERSIAKLARVDGGGRLGAVFILQFGLSLHNIPINVFRKAEFIVEIGLASM